MSRLQEEFGFGKPPYQYTHSLGRRKVKPVRKGGTNLPTVYQIDTKMVVVSCRPWYDTSMVVCYTGGGTLGHVYPALAVHEQMLESPSYEAFWIGRNEQRERAVVEAAGLPFFAIRSGKFRRYRSMRNLLDIGNICLAFFQALRILSKRRPDVLFSKGGFVSVPPVLAAYALRIVVVSHESDTTAGLATRINARFSRTICVSHDLGLGSLPASKLFVSGNPVRRALVEQAKNKDSLPRPAFLHEGEPLVVVLGGSSGSEQINTLVRRNLQVIAKKAFIYHQCGQEDRQALVSERYQEVAFIKDELAQVLSHATVVVSRAGAGSLAELALFGCACLLIPLSTSTSRGDQVENAQRLANAGAARVLLGDVDDRSFTEALIDLLDDEEARRELGTALGAGADWESAKRIAHVLMQI